MSFFMLFRFSLSSSTFPLSALSILITSVLKSISSRWLVSFCLVLFLEFHSFLLFGTCFFVSSFWQASCVCFYVLGRAAVFPSLGRVA